jgi:hypothetical protein
MSAKLAELEKARDAAQAAFDAAVAERDAAQAKATEALNTWNAANIAYLSAKVEADLTATTTPAMVDAGEGPE